MPIIDNLIQNFSHQSLTQFLRNKISSYKSGEDDLGYLFEDDIFEKYESIEKIGEAVIDKDDLIVIISKTTDPLTERTGKKKQYEIAKKILKEEVKDAALFIFHDDVGNFRFSFVKANYLGTKRDFTDFKRYTYFVTPEQSNKTFIKQVGGCNFNSLDEIIEAFSVEPLNKLFYQEIAKAFYSLIGGKIKIGTVNKEFDTILKLPSTPIDGNRKIYQEFDVRLIGRTIFCWFLKSKKSNNGIPLIPKSWLSSERVVDVNNNQHNYYHTIIEKLFFLVLNKKQNNRTPYDLPSEQELIPFLNGGLFEPHLDDFYENEKPNFALDIPNLWFKELFGVLEQFNFTIDENSINDAEVSIDPEMLGTIFENLLAEIDPDTEKSARKATGSFYTPREIVDYMVEQSLIQYLKTKIEIDDEELLQQLFKEGGENKFDPSETKNILQALSDVKILDPACGSGAFPMGALHKIINALHKLDPDASWWKKRQIENVPNILAQKMLKEKLDSASADYIRKLGIIQNSIYGVDIQPIAAEISKLRSFLSLVIDENIDDDAENRGIEPLPNLEFKFVTANTLIGLEEKNISVLDFGQTEELQDQLKEIRNKYLQSYGKEKDKLKKEFEEVQTQIYKNEISGGGQNRRALQLASWKPFSNESSAWFDPYWMYGVEKFDIVIGNPPYVVGKFSFNEKEYFSEEYKSAIYQTNLYMLFTEKGMKLLKNDASILTLIIPNTWLINKLVKEFRLLLIENLSIHKIIDCTKAEVFDATVLPIILIAQNKKNYDFNILIENYYNKIFIYRSTIGYLNIREDENNIINYQIAELEIPVVKKIVSDSKKLSDYANVTFGVKFYQVGKGNPKQTKEIVANHSFTHDEKINKTCKKILEGKNIDKYVLNEPKKYIEYGEWLAEPRAPDMFEGKRILIRRIISENGLICHLIRGHYCNNSLLHTVKLRHNSISSKYILAILNSNVIGWFFIKYFARDEKTFPEIRIHELNSIPIRESKYEEHIDSMVDLLLKNNIDKESFNRILKDIDILLYKTYNLTYNEVLLIEPKFKLTKEEYENYNIDYI